MDPKAYTKLWSQLDPFYTKLKLEAINSLDCSSSVSMSDIGSNWL
jgi:hypothetical protein